jgi:16S rRNA (uracil1498-N3)-methyltransferase
LDAAGDGAEMHRFFVPSDSVRGGNVTFSSSQSHQIAKVLRLQAGESVAVLDNAGWLYEVALVDVAGEVVSGTVRTRRLAPGEPRTKLTLYPALLKSDRLEFAFQKCTEIGVSAFVPMLSDRCNVGAVTSPDKQRRWERIIAEAAEQSERGRMPQLFPMVLFPQACEQARGLSLIACERGERRNLRDEITGRLGGGSGQRLFAVNLFVGPEGGFSGEELECATSYGVIPIGLGPRILRAETASVVGSALLLAFAGDLD